MIPFFPSLRPQIANRIWFEINTPPSEDDVLRYEREHDSWKESIKNAASDIPPLGKVLTKPGPETDDEDGTYTLQVHSYLVCRIRTINASLSIWYRLWLQPTMIAMIRILMMTMMTQMIEPFLVSQSIRHFICPVMILTL